MRRILVALCAVLALTLGVAACGGDDDSGGGGSTSTSAAASSGGGVTIKMQNIQFAPKDTTVKVGQKVTWTNDDSTDHNVTADSGADFKSKDFGKGSTFEFTADKAGTIKYECTLHPGMTGTLNVTG
ncbi:MAG TPA: plastocyanin/azurin family copper-binding protein [Solirubrobacteraceae bacterium]|jgi:plastocyanin|nr:plastocyanin/azurin family copper-binding protein [Solirubrobacteraceae bacterium]